MKMDFSVIRLFCLALCLSNSAIAGTPLWSFTPLTATTVDVPSNGTATVQYQVTNHSAKIHTLVLQPITGITQNTSGNGICGTPFILQKNASCILSLQVNGNALSQSITDGPIVCEQASKLQCYRPAAANTLRITQAAPILSATIAESGSPVTLISNGSSSTLTINNTSLTVTALNIMSDFTSTALDGNVTETGNTCASVPPQSSCTLTFTPGNTVVSQTDFNIHGSNTNTITAAIQINPDLSLSGISPVQGPASGGTGITLTGVGLTGTTSVTFGGVAATSVNVVNSTTITVVSPAHAVGVVDVAITTPGGSAGIIAGYTYQTTAVGQTAYGGTIACLNGANNLIASVADNSAAIEWGGLGMVTNSTSTTDGETNTGLIVSNLGNNSGTPYAAKLCSDFEVDSQGNTPCEAGNTCYSDWFLPAGNNAGASGQLNCLYTNRVAVGGFSAANYWSSTENSANHAWIQGFNDGTESHDLKNNSFRVRCVRAFTP